ncbi:MAG TPA: helicase-related protein, partial [Dokdonella sp.]
VLDEADEMLRMGFIDDVEAVLKKTPPTRQIALFSATMPTAIRRIAQTYLRDPIEISIKNKTTTAANIRQRYWYVSGMQKLDALTRILEAEPFEAMIIFARTKQGTEELAQKLQARGFGAAAINGDVVQMQRERMIQQLRDGKLDILVATDVAARGLDVERISHVLNYDIPTDTEAYVHRIGRTGRAGRSGEAILFVAPREKRMLQSIERATRQPISEMQLPSVEAVNDQRITRFKQRITQALGTGGLGEFQQLIEQYEREHNVPAVEIAAALARLAQGEEPLLLKQQQVRADASHERAPRAFERGPREPRSFERPARDARPPSRERDAAHDASPPHKARPSAPASANVPAPPKVFPGTGLRRNEEASSQAEAAPAPRGEHAADAPRAARTETRPPRSHHAEETEKRRPRRDDGPHKPEAGFETFRIEVGHTHGVQPGNIVGALANEAGLDSKHIGRVDIRDDHSLVDLPDGMPPEIFKHLKKVWVSGQQLRITRGGEAPDFGKPRKFSSPKPPSFKGGAGGFEKPKRRPK